MNRRDFLKMNTALLASGYLTSCAVSEPQKRHPVSGKKPNIIFIMVDDLGKEWVSCYGAKDIQTPNIDKLAAGGMQFSNAYSMPQCTPTRTTLLTGQYPWRSGWVNHWDVPRWGAGCHFDPQRNITFARFLKKAGYKTAAAGKWQLNDFRVQPDIMKDHGFDEYCMWTGYEADNPASSKRYWDPYIHTSEGSKTYSGKFGEDVFMEFMTDFMKRNKEQPMVIYYPMCLTHTPVTTTPHDKKAKSKLDKFKAMVRYTDYLLGELVDTLDELGIRENTIIFWTTDNGTTHKIVGHLGDKAIKGGKAALSENGICEPFIVNCPGLVPAGVKTDALTDFTDMLPTFVELAGERVPEDIIIDGKSIAKLILGKAADSDRQWILGMGAHPAQLTADRRVVGKVEHADRVIRNKRFKLWIEEAQPSRLYDLKNDPYEEKNLIDSDSPELVKAKDELIKVWKSFPAKDAAPNYTPLPPQPWDKKAKKD